MNTPASALSFSMPDTTTILLIIGFFILAWIISWITGFLVRRILTLTRFAPKSRRPSKERTRKLQVLIGSLISFIVFLIAGMISLSLFIPASTLIWILGLFSAAFGLGARPLVSDLLAGMGFLFSETFDIGEKVEFIIPGNNIQGVIEEVNLTATIVRAPSGEQYTLPNGEIRIVRNFSRGKFSLVNISLYISVTDLTHTIDVLRSLGEEAYHLVDDLIEPWQILSTSDLTTSKVELRIVSHAALGHGANIKLDLINMIQERLKNEGITIID
jgi:moderate conductance mechanosensitive channel